MEDARKLVKTTYQKWVGRIKKIIDNELCVIIDPNPPLTAMATIKIVKSLEILFVLPNYIESKMVELKDLIEGFQDYLIPPFFRSCK